MFVLVSTFCCCHSVLTACTISGCAVVSSCDPLTGANPICESCTAPKVRSDSGKACCTITVPDAYCTTYECNLDGTGAHCLMCQDGFYLDANNVCQGCGVGQTLVAGTCMNVTLEQIFNEALGCPLIANCEVLAGCPSGISTCSTCQPGHYLSAAGDTCTGTSKAKTKLSCF